MKQQGLKQTQRLAHKADSPIRPRPLLRCPLCGESTPMPATNCAHCRADFKTGYRKPRFGILSIMADRILATVLAGAVFSMMGFMGWLVWNYHKTRPPILAQNPDSFEQLAQKNPNLLRPYVLVLRAREAVSNFNDSLYNRQDFLNQMKDMDGSSIGDDKNAEYAQRLTPRQRAQMLRELSQVINDGKRNDEYVTTTPAQRNELLKEIDQVYQNR